MVDAFESLENVVAILQQENSTGVQVFALIFQTVVQQFSLFFQTGDLAYLLAAAINLAPVIGFFFAIYALVYYLGVITLFKDKDHHRFAKMFAVGLALTSMAVGNLFKLFLTLVAGSFMTVFIVIFIIFALVILVKRLRSQSALAGAELNQAKSALSRERKDANAAFHDEDKAMRDHRREDRLLRREKKNINKAQRAIAGRDFLGLNIQSSAFAKAKTMQQRLDVMAQTLATIASLGDAGVTGDRKQQLLKESQQMAIAISAEYKDWYKIEQIMQSTKRVDLDVFQLEQNEVMNEKKIHDFLVQELQAANVVYATGQSADETAIRAEMKDDEQIIALEREIRAMHEDRKKMIDEAIQLNSDVLIKIKQVHDYMDQFQQYVNSGNISQAHSAVLSAANLLRGANLEENKINNLLQRWFADESHENALRNKVGAELADIAKRIKTQFAAKPHP